MEVESGMQWHPAFCAAMALELRTAKKILYYEREYNLGKMPLKVDLLIIKKKLDEVIQNEIGDFFRSSNLLEFKSPEDEMNVNTFYKVLSYACLYKAETGTAKKLTEKDITISLIRERKPLKLLQQLENEYTVTKKSPGIYRVEGVLFPMQIIVTRELDPTHHIWLKALTRSLRREEAEKLLDHFEELQESEDKQNAEAVLNLATDANEVLFRQFLKGDGKMTETLKRMVAPELVQLQWLVLQKDREIAHKETEIANKDTEIADMKIDIVGKEAEIANKDTEIANKDTEIADMKIEIVEKETKISNMKEEIAFLKRQLRKRS